MMSDEDSLDPNTDQSPLPPPTSATTVITPSTRITQLNQIDHQISTLLTSASTATAILSSSSTSSDHPSTLSQAQTAFTNATALYFSTLSSIEVQLRRQVYALEEAGLIATGDERDARRGRALNDHSEDAGMRRGGGGPLDPSWLNARAGGGGVEERMRRELLEKAKVLMRRVRKEGEDADGMDTSGGDGES